MKPFDISRGNTWEDGAGETAEPAEAAPRSTGPLPEGGLVASARRWLARRDASPSGAARADDRGASFDEIYEEHHGLVWSMLTREGIPSALAQEILQDVFVTLHGEMGKGALRNAAAMLVTITGNEIRNYRARRASRPEMDDTVDLDEVPASRPDAEGQMISAERVRKVRAVLAAMPPGPRALIDQIDLELRPQQEIADAMNLPLGTLKSRLRAARAMFLSLAAEHG